MRRFNKMILFSSVCLLTITISGPSYSQWPTFDAAKVTESINSYATTAKSYVEDLNAAKALADMQQAIGDNVSSITKFVDENEEIKKAQEKAEKLKKRKEKLDKLREKAQKAYSDAQEYQKQAQDYANTAKDYADTAKSAAAALGDAGSLANAAKSAVSGATGISTDAFNNLPNIGGGKSGNSSSNSQDTVADFFDNDDFTQDTWQELPQADVSDTTANPTDNIRRPFGNKANIENNAMLPEAQPSDAENNARAKPQSLKSAIENITSGSNTNANAGTVRAVEVRDDVRTGTVKPLEEGELESLKAIGGVEGVTTSIRSGIQSTTQKIGENAKNPQQPENAKSLKESIENIKQQSAAQPAQSEPKRKAFGKPLKSSINQTLDALKTSSNDVSFSITHFSQFAQQTEKKDVKIYTGTDESGNYIYSDVIATECQMNYDEEITFERVQQCLNIWIKGLDSPEQQTKEAWVFKHDEASQNNISAGLAQAQVHKNYAAGGDKVAEDLTTKGKATATERDELAFSGKVNQVNQDIIIKLMNAYASQVITNSFNQIRGLEADYLDEDTEETKNE